MADPQVNQQVSTGWNIHFSFGGGAYCVTPNSQQSQCLPEFARAELVGGRSFVSQALRFVANLGYSAAPYQRAGIQVFAEGGLELPGLPGFQGLLRAGMNVKPQGEISSFFGGGTNFVLSRQDGKELLVGARAGISVDPDYGNSYLFSLLFGFGFDSTAQ